MFTSVVKLDFPDFSSVIWLYPFDERALKFSDSEDQDSVYSLT